MRPFFRAGAGRHAATLPRTAAVPGHDAVQHVLDRAVTEGGLPGVLAEIRDGNACWSGTAGVADTATGEPRGHADRFRIGSITKTFVAVVVLQLAAEHRLSLDDTVETWLPGLVTGGGHDGWRVTVRRLLDHTSGIYSYTNDPAALSEHESYTPRMLVEAAMAHPASFAPGTDWEYSNTNYVLAGMIAEKASGRALADEIDARIAGPLGLSGTYLPRGDDETIDGPHARHYTTLHDPSPGARVHDITEMNTTPYWAAGAMVSTVGDLNRFFAALLSGELGRAEMFTTTPTKNWIADTAYGLGVTSLRLGDGTRLWGMGGAIFGSWTYSYGTRDGRRVLTVNSNGDWARGEWSDPIGAFTEVLEAGFGGGAGG
ncbi:serine hydrolase domain-containing protein [Phytomonospora sp. NPDC050363]|uniref:serine hydrolase domain-containing protein n=1 Tax=Phytomonospora sp. NPDC050363 TaxID=3155642 RepID=UPI0033BFFB32